MSSGPNDCLPGIIFAVRAADAMQALQRTKLRNIVLRKTELIDLTPLEISSSLLLQFRCILFDGVNYHSLLLRFFLANRSSLLPLTTLQQMVELDGEDGEDGASMLTWTRLIVIAAVSFWCQAVVTEER